MSGMGNFTYKNDYYAIALWSTPYGMHMNEQELNTDVHRIEHECHISEQDTHTVKYECHKVFTISVFFFWSSWYHVEMTSLVIPF